MSKAADQSSSPLSNLLVVALEQAVAAPMCTLRLADAGARVIKVERESGDTARGYDDAVHGMSAFFAWLNRGKESVVANIKSEEDRLLLENLVSRADVFIQNVAPGAAARLGLQADQLVERYPRIVAVDIVGFGSDTSYNDVRAYDMIIQAESGLCAITGTEDVPSKVGVSVADICTGMNAHAAILEALLVREKTGRGRAIEIAMFDGLADWMSVPLLHQKFLGAGPSRVGLSHAQIYPYGRFKCADGSLIIAVQNQEEWGRFCVGILEQEVLIADPRFVSNRLRLLNRSELDEIIAERLTDMPQAALTDLLNRHRIVWGNVSSVRDLESHPALRRIWVDAPGGRFETVASPIHPQLVPRPVPALGEHTELVRVEFGM